MRTTGRRNRLAAVCALALVLSGCATVSDFFGEPAVLDTGIEPTELAFTGPTYAVTLGDTLLVRNGGDQTRLPGATALGWLPDGRLLTRLPSRAGRMQVVDAALGPTGPAPRFREEPSEAVAQINELESGRSAEQRLRTYDLALEQRDLIVLPPTDNPDATRGNELARNYYGAVPTIDGVTFAKWHDGSEWYLDGDYGVLRIEGDDQQNVLLNANLVGLYLSVDGTGLLGLRQSSGEPCGGCVVEQDIVEIDPTTGEIGAEYGVPDPYEKGWKVAAMDKVGDRVAVRYYEAIGSGARFSYEQRGTWVYDGAWAMVDDSETELTWWQGDGRVVARVDPTERRRGDGFDLLWVHEGDETPLRGELSQRPLGGPVGTAVAGQLLASEP